MPLDGVVLDPITCKENRIQRFLSKIVIFDLCLGVYLPSWTSYGVQIFGVGGDKGCPQTVSFWIQYLVGNSDFCRKQRFLSCVWGCIYPPGLAMGSKFSEQVGIKDALRRCHFGFNNLQGKVEIAIFILCQVPYKQKLKLT